MRPARSRRRDTAPGCAAGKLCNGRSCGNGGEERVHFPALPPGGEKPPVAHKTELLPGGERFRRSPHRFKAGFQRCVVFAVARGVGRAGGARRGCVASVRKILAEDGFRPAVRADRAGGGEISGNDPGVTAGVSVGFDVAAAARDSSGRPAAAIAPARNTSVNIRMTTLFFIVFSFREAFIRRGRSRPYCRLIPHCSAHCSALRASAP